MSQKTITLEVTSLDGVKVGAVKRADGWGDDATEVTLTGRVADIKIVRDGKTYAGLRVLENGDLILTGYQTVFDITVDRNLRLTSARRWEE